jgi:cytochrome b561
MAESRKTKTPEASRFEARAVRVALMVVYAFIWYFVLIGFLFVSALQVIFVVADDRPNPDLKALQARLRAYMAAMAAFLDYSSEARPFPLSPFPED